MPQPQSSYFKYLEQDSRPHESFRKETHNTMNPSSLNILIAGGGICGLSCAVALRRSGHDVRILERSQFSKEVGAAITLPPSAVRILQSWDLDFRKARMIKFEGMEVVTGEGDSISKLGHYDFSGFEEAFGSPYLLSHRVDLHEALRDLATSPNVCSKYTTSSKNRWLVRYPCRKCASFSPWQVMVMKHRDAA